MKNNKVILQGFVPLLKICCLVLGCFLLAQNRPDYLNVKNQAQGM